jgi:putative oxidoreductase
MKLTEASSLEPYARFLLRIVAGFTFSLHGCQKLFGLFGGMGGAKVPFLSLHRVAGFLEFFGGL